jgi:uncharacterized protein YbjT (DUF2867 family)
MKIAVVGAGGFVGSNLIEYLLANTNHKITAITKKSKILNQNKKRLYVEYCDVFDTKLLVKKLKNCDCAVYLIHQLGSGKEWAKKEERATESFSQAALSAGIKKVIYLGGLASGARGLSAHLISRQKTGKILKNKLPKVIELRTSVIIGRGSASFDLINELSKRYPIMLLPRWANTKIQPIALLDVLKYITTTINKDIKESQIIEIGGPEILTYKQLIIKRARYLNKKSLIFTLPFLPKWPGKLLLKTLLPINKNSKIVDDMLDSLTCEMVVTNNSSQKAFACVKPMSIEESFSKY